MSSCHLNLKINSLVEHCTQIVFHYDRFLLTFFQKIARKVSQSRTKKQTNDSINVMKVRSWKRGNARLSRGTRCAIRWLSQSGMHDSEIATRLSCSRKAVRLWEKQKQFQRETTTQATTKSTTITIRVKTTTRRFISCDMLLKNYQQVIHIYIYIYNNVRRNRIFPYKTKKKLRLTKEQMKKRVEYIQSMPYNNRILLLNHLKPKKDSLWWKKIWIRKATK